MKDMKNKRGKIKRAEHWCERRQIMSSLIDYAKEEIKRAGLFDSDSDYNGMLGKAVMELIEVFSRQGHSGLSAHFTLGIFDKVARFKPLTSLTYKKDEWNKVTEDTWQNKRDFSVFSKDGGKTHYSIDKRK